MKIAILTSGILPIPSVQGGAVENLVDFYLEYNERHHLHDITIYSVWNEQVKNHSALSATSNHYYYIDTTSFLAKFKRKIYSIFHKNEYYNHFIEYYFEEAYKHIKGKNYDCIIIENRPGYALKLSIRESSKLVLHLHNDLLNNKTPHHHEIYNHFSQILTVSAYIKGRVSSITPHDKIQIVYNGIDSTQFSPKNKPTVDRGYLGLASNDFVIVFSGRINKDKGISELIDAMLLLKDTPQIKLLVIGSTFFGNAPNEDDFVRSLKEKAQTIKNNIIFTGFIPYTQIPNYLQLANIAIIPSVWNDPFPTTILEAQAMGLPIIASKRGGIPEALIGKKCIIIDINCNLACSIANAILEIKNHYSDYQGNCLNPKFTKETYAQSFFKCIENIRN